jgi:hypothetical protein
MASIRRPWRVIITERKTKKVLRWDAGGFSTRDAAKQAWLEVAEQWPGWKARYEEHAKGEPKLQEIIITYLESKGWYFDWEHIREITWFRDDAETIRKAHAWTIPQWGEYWMKPYSDDPTHANYGEPKTRRYESLQEALWSQLLREEQPEDFACFFDAFLDKEDDNG